MEIRMETSSVFADIVVVGGGVAGAVAAIEASNYGMSIVLIDKGKFGFHGSSCTSDGETSAVFCEEDSKEQYLCETILGGENLSVPQLTKTLVDESREAIEKLKNYGVPFAQKPDGSFDLYKELGMNYPRSLKMKGGGPAFMLALRKEALHRGIRVYENIMVHDLFFNQDGTKINGCLGLDLLKGNSIVFNSRVVILAAGSCTQLYPHATASFTTTGDGYWLGYQAGAEFINMEFPEFSALPAPGGQPLSSGGIKPLTGQGAKFYNSLGQRFMKKYDADKKEMVKRSQLVRGLFTEIKEGRGPVYMDLTHISEEKLLEMESTLQLGIINRLMHIGVNYREERFQWLSPAIHTFLGGLRTDKHGRTTIPGLYAVGENAGGVYGADRVGTFLSACVVFGFECGRGASEDAMGYSLDEVDKKIVQAKVKALWNDVQIDGKGTDPVELGKWVRKTAGEYLALDRSNEGLQKAIEVFEQVASELKKAEVKDVAGLVNRLETRNMALTGKLVAKAALRREESRGQHQRLDFLEKDKAWEKWIIMHKDLDGLNIKYEKI